MTESPAPQPTVLQRIAKVVFVVELTIGAICVLIILALIFLQAAQRYLPFDSIAWTGEVSRFALVWLTFSAMGILVSARGHIALEVVDTFRNKMLVRIIQVFALVVVAAVGVGLVIEASALIATQSIIRSPVLRLPMSWVYVPVLIGAISTAIRAGIFAIDVAIHGPVLPAGEEEESEASA